MANTLSNKISDYCIEQVCRNIYISVTHTKQMDDSRNPKGVSSNAHGALDIWKIPILFPFKTNKANQRNGPEKQQPHYAHSVSETNQQWVFDSLQQENPHQ
jgi:hypothetical protein